MALRVLLADENVTIKKVIQLVLSDYAVTVKSVNLGIDVLEVARSFNPDIIFADILLQKRNGYEVCRDFKSDSGMSEIPIVLLWSGFMELDRERYKECGADGELEKPFDKDALRQLIRRLVNKTRDHSLSEHIQLPELPPQEEIAQAPPPQKEQPSSMWDMNSFDEIEDFVQQPLSSLSHETAVDSQNLKEEEPDTDDEGTVDLDRFHPMILPREEPPAPVEPQGAEAMPEPEADEDDEEEWVRQPIAPKPVAVNSRKTATPEASEPWIQGDLSEFRLDVPVEDSENGDLKAHFNLDAMDEDVASNFIATDDHVPQEAVHEERTEDYQPINHPASDFDLNRRLSEEDLEEILRAQSRELIESVVWKVVPDLAEKIIREELEKIMKDSDI